MRRRAHAGAAALLVAAVVLAGCGGGEVEPDEAEEAAEAEVSFTIDRMRLGEVDLPDDQRAQIERSFVAMDGASGSYRVDDRGGLSAADFDLPQVPGFEQLGDQVMALAAPVPEAPIGPGAVWTVEQDTQIGGMTLQQVVEVRLVERDGDLVTLEMTTTGGTPPGPVELPGAGGMQAEIVRSEMTGEGTTVLDLSSPLPRRAEMNGLAEQEMRFPEDAGLSTMEQSVRMSLTLGPA